MTRKVKLPQMGALVRHVSSGAVGTVQGRGLVAGEPGALVCAEAEQPRWLPVGELVVVERAAA